MSLDELIGISQELENKDVVIVEDIVDTGKTIKYIIDKLKCKSINIRYTKRSKDIGLPTQHTKNWFIVHNILS